MRLFDFECDDCHHQFEDILADESEQPACPRCGSGKTRRMISAGHLKTNPAPFKVGPVNQNFVNRVHQAEAGIKPSCSAGCASCQHNTGNTQS